MTDPRGDAEHAAARERVDNVLRDLQGNMAIGREINWIALAHVLVDAAALRAAPPSSEAVAALQRLCDLKRMKIALEEQTGDELTLPGGAVKREDIQRYYDQNKESAWQQAVAALASVQNDTQRSGALDAEWCVDAFWRVNPGRNATVPSLYLLDFAREVLRVHGATALSETVKPDTAKVPDGWRQDVEDLLHAVSVLFEIQPEGDCLAERKPTKDAAAYRAFSYLNDQVARVKAMLAHAPSPSGVEEGDKP